MAINVTNTKYFDTGSISFSQIKNTFGGREKNIRASEYLRQVNENNLDDNDATPTIPDSIENSNIPTNIESNQWKVSAFRKSNKEIVIVQSGTNANISLTNDSSVWQNNLGRSIPKRLVINGTVYSSNVNNYALTISGGMRNLDVEVSKTGQVLGAGGGVNQNGGGALYINNTRNESPVDLYSYGKIWSGGGGGSSGNPGNNGGTLFCSTVSYFGTSNPYSSGGDQRNLSEAMPGRACRRVRSGSTWYSASPTGTRNRCRGGSRRGGGDAYWVANQQRGNYQCSRNWSITCQYYISSSFGGGGRGNGGTGGTGEGYNQQRNNGNSGNSGNCSSCPGGWSGGSSCGNRGNDGSAGGSWGQAGNGGGAGDAVKRKNVRIQYSTTNTIKGPIRNI